MDNICDINYMERCIELGLIAKSNGESPVGCILVYKGKVIAEGIETVKSNNDITGHAEMLAIKDAIKNGHADHLHEATMYTTHEPCWMCSYAIRSYKLHKVVYAISIPSIGGDSSPYKVLHTDAVDRWSNGPIIVRGFKEELCQKTLYAD